MRDDHIACTARHCDVIIGAALNDWGPCDVERCTKGYPWLAIRRRKGEMIRDALHRQYKNEHLCGECYTLYWESLVQRYQEFRKDMRVLCSMRCLCRAEPDMKRWRDLLEDFNSQRMDEWSAAFDSQLIVAAALTAFCSWYQLPPDRVMPSVVAEPETD